MMGVSFLSRSCAVISTHLCVEGSLANVQSFWKLIWKLIYRLLNSKKGSHSELLGQQITAFWVTDPSEDLIKTLAVLSDRIFWNDGHRQYLCFPAW